MGKWKNVYKILSLASAAALGISGCGTGVRGRSAADSSPSVESSPSVGSSFSSENRQNGGDNGNSTDTSAFAAENVGHLNEWGLDEATMDEIKYNIYVKLNNTVVETLHNISSYFQVVDTAEVFQLREDTGQSYGDHIVWLSTDILEDAELIRTMEPAYDTLDGLVEEMLPSLREILETFNAIHDSGSAYEQNQYQQPRENHARLMSCLEEFNGYAYAFLDEVDLVADERNAQEEAEMLEEGLLIIYHFSHMLTVSSQILDEIYDQGIDDYNLIELDLDPIQPLLEELQATAAAYDTAVDDPNQLLAESLSSQQVSVGKWQELLDAFARMIERVESGEPYEDPSQEYLGGLQHIYTVLSDCVEDYNTIFGE